LPDVVVTDQLLSVAVQHIGPSTSAKIVLYDPTEHSTTDTPVALIESWLKGKSTQFNLRNVSTFNRCFDYTVFTKIFKT